MALNVLDEEKAAKDEKSRQRYLWWRNRKLHASQTSERVRDWFLTSRRFVREGFQGVCLGLLALAVTEALSHGAQVIGLSTWVAHKIAELSTLDTPTNIPDEARTALAALVVGVAGVMLPLYFTLLGTVLSSTYGKAPERVRNLLLSDRVARLYRILVIGLGVEGVLILAFSRTGWLPGSVTLAFVAFMAITAFVAFLSNWWRLIEQGNPIVLIQLVYKPIQRTLKRTEGELAGANDAEALVAFRRTLADQIAILHDLATFTLSLEARHPLSAIQLAVAVQGTSTSYGRIVGKIPRGSLWALPTRRHAAIIRSGGGTDKIQETSRVIPQPTSEGDSLWVERRLADVAADALLLALKGEGESDLDHLFELLTSAIQQLARGGSIEGGLHVQQRLAEAYEERRKGPMLSAAVDILVFNRIDSISAVLLDVLEGSGLDDAAREALTSSLLTVEGRAKGLATDAGPEVKTAFQELREQLDNELAIEGAILTSRQFIAQRLKAAHQKDRAEQVGLLVTSLSKFYVEFGNRIATGANRLPALAGHIQAWHMIRRIERRFGETIPPLHALDHPRYHITDQKLKDKVESLRSGTLLAAANVLALEASSSKVPEDLPDIVGAAYYYSASEAMARLGRAPWQNVAVWLGRYLDATWGIIDATAQQSGNVAAMLSPVQEAARVSGYAIIWSEIRGASVHKAVLEEWKRTLQKRVPKDKTLQDVALALVNLSGQASRLDRPRYAQRFDQTLEAWDTLAEAGFANRVGYENDTPTASAMNVANGLVRAVSANHDNLHKLDSFFFAILASELGIPIAKLGKDLQEASKDLDHYKNLGESP